ncbi:MAG: GEVED domain-containing protein, partial [Ilumatobacteraceae bacterium]|nr:GEVED domain-containing protein [Ilumatobacteraceae bacterium]
MNTAGTTLTLTYNENLGSTTAATTDFTVLVDGSPVTVSGRAVSTRTVVLTLSSTVSGSSTVTVAYSAPTSSSATSNSAIQDAAGNDAVSLSATSVTNSSTVGPPTLRTAVLSSAGSVLTLTFSETLTGINNSTIQSLFTVYSDGSPVTTSGSSCCGSGNTYTLNLASVITSNRIVTISYAAPTPDTSTTNSAVQDSSGTDLLSITNFPVTNGSTVAGDTTAPTFQSAAVNTAGTTLTLTYDENLGSTAAATTDFTVLVDGYPVTVSSTTVSGRGVILTLGNSVSAGQTVTVAYTAPTSSTGASNSAIQDSAGNDAVTLSTTAVTNNSTAGPDIAPPTLSTVSLNGAGSQATLTFNEALGSVAPSASAFTVYSGNNIATVTGVSVSGSTVILTLSPTVSTTEKLTVAYTAPTSNSGTSNAAVQDVRGNDAVSFNGSNQPTNNSWTWTGASTGATAGCTGSNYANRSKSKDLPNGVTYTVGVSGDYFCMGDQTESLSERGGAAGDFTSTGLVTEPGVYLQTSNSGCAADAMCLNRGTLTISFSKPVSDPVVSFAGWGGGSGSSVAWSELELLTPGVTVTALSGTNIEVVNSGTYVQPLVKNPAIKCHQTSGYGATAQAGCGSLQINGTVTSVSFNVNLGTVRGTGYIDGWNLVASIPEDFGLVPVSYDNPVASHAVGSLKLGAVVTADQPSTLYATTNGDAVAAGAVIPTTDDGVATWPTLSAADVGLPYSISVSLAGVTSTAHLCAWIDFNNDDVFTPSERACATDPVSGTTSTTITWTIPSDVTSGATYARVRLSYDDLPLPTGKVSSGEVEDYSVTVRSASVPAAINDTSSGAKGATQTLSPLSNDQVEAGFPAVATSLKLCGVGVGPFVCNKTSLTVSGEGTYTVNSDGTVTFVPSPDFTGTATPVTYEMADTQSRTSSALITPTVRPAPVAVADTSQDFVNTTQSKDPLTNDTSADSSTPLTATSVRLCGTGQSAPGCTATTVSVTGGVYTVNTSTGVITFNPSTNWTGTAPAVTYQVSDSLSQVASSTYTPTVIPPPVATNDTSSGAHDTNQTITPFSNDTPGTVSAPLDAASLKLCDVDDPTTSGVNEAQSPNRCDKTIITIPGEGTYTVNPNGTVTFDPLSSFRGTATPVTYQATDSLGQYESATITPTVAAPTAPIASPETQSVIAGASVSFTNVIGTSALASGTGLQTGSTNGPCIVNPATSVCGSTLTVTGEGTWSIDQTTGIATFTASSSITSGTKTPVTYRVTDVTGQTATSTLTPIVPPPPSASNDTSSGAHDTNQTITILSNDTPGAPSAPLVASTVKLCGLSPLQTPNSCDKTSVTVTGEGTYTVNTDGSVTFDPESTFTGTVTTPVTYQVADTLGQIDSATITPTVGDPPLPSATSNTSSGAHDTNQTITILSNDTAGASDFPFVAATVKLCGLSPLQTPNSCDKTSITVTGEGTYTVNTDGSVTFDPESTFDGTVTTPVTYQVADTLNRVVSATITPTVAPPTAPAATPETQAVLPGGTITFTTITGSSGLATGTGLVTSGAGATCIVDPATSTCGTSVTIASEGTWTLNQSTGVVTFAASGSITSGTKTPITYQVTDVVGQTATSTLTPVVPPAPIATNDTSSGNWDSNQTITILSNDTAGAPSAPLAASTVKLCGLSPLQTPNSCDKTSVTVPGEGTYTVNTDGS